MLVRHPQPSARSVLTRLHMLGRSLAAMHGGSGLLLAARVSLSFPAAPGPCLSAAKRVDPGLMGAALLGACCCSRRACGGVRTCRFMPASYRPAHAVLERGAR